jgi:hypothetical protein
MRAAYPQGVSWLLARVAIKWLFLLPTLEELGHEQEDPNSTKSGSRGWKKGLD